MDEQGVHPSIRGEVWEFLLGCYIPESSPEARHALRSIRRCFLFFVLPGMPRFPSIFILGRFLGSCVIFSLPNAAPSPFICSIRIRDGISLRTNTVSRVPDRRKEYERLKETCMSMDTAVGSGDVVTAIRVQENGSEVKSAEGGLRRRNVNKERSVHWQLFYMVVPSACAIWLMSGTD